MQTHCVSTRRPSGLVIATLFLTVLMTAPAFAGRPECTCQNIESLQQDYQNAVFLEDYMRRLAQELAAVEARQIDLNKNHPTDPDSGRDVKSVADQARAAFERANLNLPFPQVTGYTGPKRIDMPSGTCTQDDGQLKALEKGSPCEAMADSAAAHEQAHRHLCNKMGQAAYWARPLSEMMFEEAAAYHAQAANLKTELRRVLEAATIVYKGRWPFTLKVPGAMEVEYLYVTSTTDLGNATSGDTWKMTGTGTTTTTIEKAVIAGMTCTGSGSVDAHFDATLTTDGLTFGLKLAGRVTGGSPAISCPGGGGGFGLPPPDNISDTVARNVPLKAGDTQLGGGWGNSVGFGMIGGVADMVLSVTCPAQ